MSEREERLAKALRENMKRRRSRSRTLNAHTTHDGTETRRERTAPLRRKQRGKRDTDDEQSDQEP